MLCDADKSHPDSELTFSLLKNILPPWLLIPSIPNTHTHHINPTTVSLSQTVMNLVNKAGQRLTQLFTQLDRRLKSQDKKKSSEVIGHEGGDDIHHKRRGDNRPPDSQTTSTDKVSMEQYTWPFPGGFGGFGQPPLQQKKVRFYTHSS